MSDYQQTFPEALRKAGRKRRRNGYWILRISFGLAIGIGLWMWLFPWLDRFINNPQVGGF